MSSENVAYRSAASSDSLSAVEEVENVEEEKESSSNIYTSSINVWTVTPAAALSAAATAAYSVDQEEEVLLAGE